MQGGKTAATVTSFPEEEDEQTQHSYSTEKEKPKAGPALLPKLRRQSEVTTGRAGEVPALELPQMNDGY